VKETKTSIWIVVFVYIVAIAIAVLDWLPQTQAIPWHGLFVIPVVWIALWSAEEDVFPVTMMAMTVNILILIPGYLTHETSAVALLGDRIIVISTIWATVFLALLRKRTRRTFKWISLIRPR
jgi:hypothetical protein